MSEVIVLRSYPLREADLIVSFLARDLGKLRGVARRARKPNNRFGSGLERLSYVRLDYFHRENRDLDTLDACELIRSRFNLASGFETSVALDFFAEVADQLLPAAEPNERFFRLLLAVTDYLVDAGTPGVWLAVNYFSLWSVRLTGILPPMELNAQDRTIAEEMLCTPITEISGGLQWTRATCAGLRKQLLRTIEEHVERRLLTVPVLEAL
jgi:DNA repair protein RecO (recombination protein O)